MTSMKQSFNLKLYLIYIHRSSDDMRDKKNNKLFQDE